MTASRLPARLLAIAVLAAVAGAIVWGFQPEPVTVEVREVTRGGLDVTVGDDGVTRIKERYAVSAPLAGRTSRVELDAGDTAEAGKTLLVTIEPTDPSLLDPRALAEAEARVEAARAARKRADPELARAKVQLEYTQADLDRARELFPSKAVSHEDLDKAERAWRTAVEEVKAAEYQVMITEYELAMAEAALVRTKPARAGAKAEASADWRMDLRSPVDGRLLRIFQESSAVVAAGAALVEVGDPTELEIVIDLVSEDAVKVKPGDRAEITAWGGTAPLAAHVRTVEPRGFMKVSPLGVEEQRVTVILDFDSPAAERPTLGDDFRVEARITVDEVKDAVLVPLSALFRRENGEAVFVVEEGRARLVAVTSGRRGDRWAEVLTGLAGGEQVIEYPADQVADGAAVRLRKTENGR